MTAVLQISLGMFTNVLVTLGCVFLVTRALPFIGRHPAGLRSLLLGLLFGVTSIASMMTAFPISDGILGDMRNAIIAIAALSAGPLAAIICAALAIGYRFALGGQFVGATIAIALCSAVSIGFALSPLKKTTTSIALFGVVLAIVNALVPFVGWFMGIAPFATVIAVAEAIFGSAIVLYPAAIVIVVSLVTGELRRLDSEAALRAQNELLSLSERRLVSVFDMSSIPMAWINLQTTRFVRVNREYETFTGYQENELVEMTLDQLSVPEDKHADLGSVRALESGARSMQDERRYLRKDGSVRWGTRTLTLSDEEEGGDKFGFAIVQDITERKRAGEQIAYLAEHDHLTGLDNRFQFRKNLDQRLSEGSTSGIAVIVIDLDDFKGVNDTRGHPIGDKVLTHVADLLRSILAPSDGVARIGGDEFAVTRPDTNATDALALAEHIISLVTLPFDIEGQPVTVGVSAGVAISPDDGADTAQLFKKADIALYASKAAGKGVAKLFDPAMEEAVLRKDAMRKQLLVALEQRQLEVEYQPVIEISNGRVCRLEALLRWNHPTGGRISPAEFIPIAEDTGAIVAVGAWVLEQACAAAMTWPLEVGVAVNVSVKQFEVDLPLRIAAALSRSGLSPNRLEVEITESVLMQGTALNLQILHQIASLGVRISLDDFGTGYSSLSYLQRFPFKKLKIDRTFVSGAPGRDADAIVGSIIQLGHSLGMTVTAEGVETVEQLDRLSQAGCDEAQGFLFSASVAAAEVLRLVGSLNQDRSLHRPSPSVSSITGPKKSLALWSR